MGHISNLISTATSAHFFCSIRTSLLVVIMKIILVALFWFSAALATPELTPDNDFGKECIDIQRNCMAAASSALERGQCWVQFGLCIATHGMKCYKTCIPPMQECIQAAGHDFMKTWHVELTTSNVSHIANNS